MSKIIVNSIQTSSGTPFNVFESQATTGYPVSKDSADGILKNATFASDIKKIHFGQTGVAADSKVISLLKADNSLKSGLSLRINANDHSWFTAPNDSNKREIRFKLKDSSGNFLSSVGTNTYQAQFTNSWSGSNSNDNTTRSYAALRTGFLNHGLYNCVVDVDVKVFQDPSNAARCYLYLLYRGRVGNSGSSSKTGVFHGRAYNHCTGTPTTLVIESNATAGNNEETFYVHNTTGYLT